MLKYSVWMSTHGTGFSVDAHVPLVLFHKSTWAQGVLVRPGAFRPGDATEVNPVAVEKETDPPGIWHRAPCSLNMPLPGAFLSCGKGGVAKLRWVTWRRLGTTIKTLQIHTVLGRRQLDLYTQRAHDQ